MLQSSYYENSYRQNYGVDYEVEDENAKNQFENSVASIGDIYRKEKKISRINSANKYNKTNKKTIINTNKLQNEPSLYNINQINLGEIGKERYDDKTILEVNYLKPAKLNASIKYSHVKGGTINPPKSSHSLKPATEKKIKQHEENIKDVTLFAHRVNIHHILGKHERKKISPIRKINENGSDEENREKVIIIGSAPTNNSEYMNRTQKINNSNILNNTTLSQRNKNKIRNETFRESSKETRNLQKKYEKLYYHTKDFFTANANKIPSSSNFEDIVHFADDMRQSLENYKKSIDVPKRPNSDYLLKDSVTKMKRKVIKPKSPKNYLDINPEDRKKIEEKLEMLHLDIRTVFDNLNLIENKSEKVEELIHKSQNLSNILKSFSQSGNMSHYHSNGIMNSLQNVIVEENETQNNDITNKRDDVDDVINVLKANMSNLQVDDNKIIFETQQNNLNQSKIFNLNKSENMLYNSTRQNYGGNDNVNIQSQNLGNNNSYNYNNNSINPGNSQMNFYSSNNFNPIKTENNTMNNFYLSQNNLSNTQNSNMYSSQNIPNHSAMNTTNQFNQNNLTNTQNFNMYSSQNIPNHNAMNTTNQFNQNNSNTNQFNNTNQLNQNIPNHNAMNTTNQFNQNNSNTNQFNNTNQLNQNNSVLNTTNQFNQNDKINQYAKLNTKNVTYEDRFSSYEVELPLNYYSNYTKLQEPCIDRDWYIRPHHIETVANNPNSIPDDVMNTKYISYYGSIPKTEEKSREIQINEVINTLETNLDKLKSELFTKATINKEYGKIHERLENMKEEIKKNYVPGQMLNDLSKSKNNITGVLSDIKQQSSYSDMYNQNENISQTNLVIKSYETLLKELRDKERFLIVQKRKDEYERIRPPLDHWYELKNNHFQDEMKRNKMVLNATPHYFNKLDDLKNEHLY